MFRSANNLIKMTFRDEIAKIFIPLIFTDITMFFSGYKTVLIEDAHSTYDNVLLTAEQVIWNLTKFCVFLGAKKVHKNSTASIHSYGILI
jgi:hypothetical protein